MNIILRFLYVYSGTINPLLIVLSVFFYLLHFILIGERKEGGFLTLAYICLAIALAFDIAVVVLNLV